MSATTFTQVAPTEARSASRSRDPGPKRTCTRGHPVVAAGECGECRKRRLQRKLSIGASNDPLEHEADRVARQMTAPTDISTAPILRRRLQRRNDRLAEEEFSAPPSVERALAEVGQVLEPSLRAEMSDRFGFDFSRVRVHVGTTAALSAREINAEAYTVGHDVVFGAGRYSSGTADGRQLIAHELTHVVQQSGMLTKSDLVQRQEAPGPKRKLTPEEYKKLDPSLQVLTWGPDFMQGLKRSGVTTQIGDVASTVIEKGFTQSMDNPIRFRSGVMVGIPVGVANAAISAVTSLAELGWDVAKLWIRLHVTPTAVGAEIVQLVKNNAEAVLGGAEPLGFGVGQQVSKEASKFGIEFINSSPFDQGFTFGKIIGRIIGEIAMLFVGVGEVSAAAKAVANTRYGRLLLEAMEASRLLKPLVESSEAAKTARAAKAAQGEAAGVEDAIKAAQEAKPEAAAADKATSASSAEKPSKRIPSHGELQEEPIRKAFHPNAQLLSEKASGFDFVEGHKIVSAHTEQKGALTVVTERIAGGNWIQLKTVSSEEQVVANIDKAMERAESALKGVAKNELEKAAETPGRKIYERAPEDLKAARENQFERVNGSYAYRSSYAGKPDRITIHLHFENVRASDKARLDQLAVRAREAVVNSPYRADIPPVSVLVTGQ